MREQVGKQAINPVSSPRNMPNFLFIDLLLTGFPIYLKKRAASIRLSMNEIKICQHCKFANRLDATLCLRCGSPLVPLLTAHVTPVVPKIVVSHRPHHEHWTESLTAENVLFVMVGEEQPIIVRKSKTLMLGREVSTDNSPSIDLSVHNAFLLGVSRQHAVIETSKVGCFVRDLESTNGTWVNERKLIPHTSYRLQSGDLLRLGHMGLYVYFQSPLPSPGEYILTDTSATITLTPTYLTGTVGPYLVLLSEINNIIDSLLQHTPVFVRIKSLYVDVEEGTIHLQSTFQEALLDFLENNVVPWKDRYNADIKKLTEFEARTVLLKTQPQDDPVFPGYIEALEELQTPLTELIAQFFSTVSPDLRDSEQPVYFDKLMPLFYRLVRSPLRIERQSILEVRE